MLFLYIDGIVVTALHAGAAAAEFSVQALPGFLQSLASIRRFVPLWGTILSAFIRMIQVLQVTNFFVWMQSH